MKLGARSLTALSSAAGHVPRETAATTFYQYAICPWCQKVRAALDYYQVQHTRIEVNPWSKKEISWSKDYKKVPIVTLAQSGDPARLEVITESDQIMRRIRAMTTSNDTLSPSEEQGLEWTNKEFIPALTVNLYRNWYEAAETFRYLSESQYNFGIVERSMAQLSGTVIMKMISPRLKKKYQIQGDERQHLFQLTDNWLAKVADHYSGGHSPNLADLAVYGALRAVEAHPVYTDLLKNTEIGRWRQEKLEGVTYRPL